MALDASTHVVRLLRCSFCGSYHGSTKEAERHGCLAGELPKDFTVGDRVIADFTVGEGMSAVGHQKVVGVIKEIAPPHSEELKPELTVQRPPWAPPGIGIQPFPIQAPLKLHEWVALVEPTEQPEEPRYIREERFFFSDLIPAEG
ncbi:MAG: hypothetical protein ABIB97_02220 [Patescibacteria group bacterium]